MDNLEQQLATPLLWYPGQCPEEFAFEFALMIERSMATRALLEGKITWDDFLCLLQEHGIDAVDADEGWREQRLIYL